MIDDERIAALLDGRLGTRDRDELLARLAALDDECHDFAETAAVLRELDESRAAGGLSRAGGGAVPAEPRTAPAARPQASGGVISLAPRLRPQRRLPTYLALAAALAGLALGAALWMHAHRSRWDDPARAVALLGPGGRGPAPGWGETWNGTGRGPPGFTDRARAVRLGAYLVDLELAAGAHDPALSPLAGRVASLLDGIDGGSAAAGIYREVQRATPGDSERVAAWLERGRRTVRRRMPVEWLELGVWAEAARTAAARHEAGFFGASASRAALDRVAALPNMDGETRAAVTEVRRRLPVKGIVDWPRLEGSTAALLRAAGR